MIDSDTGKSLIRQLASCKQSLRDKALRQLFTTWLPSQLHKLPDDDMRKLWKGLFYCFWHADKFPYQSQLINQLSSPLLSLNLEVSIQYFDVFLLTMKREWTGIDRLRLDKFYLMIRRFLSKVFEKMKSKGWELGLVKRVMGVIEEKCLLEGFNGVSYHVGNVFFEELKPFFPLRLEVFEVMVRPFVEVMGRVRDKVLLGKIKDGVFDVLLEMGRKLLEVRKSGGGVEGEDQDVVALGTVGLKMGFADRFYELGSSEGCCQGNRKVVFGLHQEFLKLEKKLATLGIEISMPEVNDAGDSGMENSIAFEAEMEEAGDGGNVASLSADNPLKKCKKKKKDSGEGDKKSKKKKKKKNNGCDPKENGNVNVESGESTNYEQMSDDNGLEFNETVMSNLQVQFEKVAAEAGLATEVASPCESPKTVNNGAVSKKRKRTKSMEGQKSTKTEQNGLGDPENSAAATAKSGEKSAKRVRFSMKNNLVWKPHSPLPPQSLRIPPSVTPRGSALKKGVPPGPVSEMPAAVTKKAKRRVVALKKGRKIIKSIPAKRVKKLKSVST